MFTANFRYPIYFMLHILCLGGISCLGKVATDVRYFKLDGCLRFWGRIVSGAKDREIRF